ncbi:hypothetical protein SCO11_15065 [Legionella pneumophila serogroup 1]|uniref:hypothetical protein n=1 Tax=Legionella pneumophila TaxID=446 RepID=UPI0007874B26|nr:hypothetical protein [Legionella pneumophila]MCZ4679697.1 hypothetical protein [Legionella pneumophila]MCZ4749722.1 hypothetical protein [Legionella pneumophila]HAT1994498.1 hypothetical protein [Legionella pneumophila]HAT2052144.1 hypothetical protein [Legionella pneumophila]HAT4435914.1 hypothetical protein [Legionella pneumophila]
MIEMIQQIFVALISVIFAKWLDKMWDGGKSSQLLLKISSEINILNTKKQSLGEQINERVFLSNWIYYVVTMIWLYCILALGCVFIFYYSKYINHPIQDNYVSQLAFEYVRGRVSPISVIFTFFLYPIVNFVSSRIFELVIKILKIMSFSFSRSEVQQIRMGTTMIISMILSVFLVYYLF